MRFDKSFRVLTLGSTLWAFVMLASTGSVPWIIAIPYIGLFLYPALRRPPEFARSAVLWRVLNVVVIGLALWGWFGLERRLDTVVYLFLYLVMNKVWVGSKNRDWLQLYALGFFMVLAASVSTASVLFAPAVVIYVTLIMATLVVYTMKRDAERTLAAPGPVSLDGGPLRVVERERARLAALAGGAFLTPRSSLAFLGGTVFVCAVALGMFFIIPRITPKIALQGLGSAIGQTQRITGFSDTVEMGGVGAIQTSPQIVARVRPARGQVERFDQQSLPAGRVSEYLRLRGVTLETWTGRRWEKAAQIAAESTQSTDELHNFVDPPVQEPGLFFQVLLEPGLSSYLFLPDTPGGIRFDRPVRMRVDSQSRTAVLASVPDQVFGYRATVESVTRGTGGDGITEAKPLPTSYDAAWRQLVRDGLARMTGPGRGSGARMRADMAPDRAAIFLNLPANPDIQVVRQVAGEWTSRLTNPIDIAREIERRFQSEFGYTLDVSSFQNREDHLTQFLRVQREGHCEYFATAMVLMLRARGIPARIVNGYLTDEFSAVDGGYYVVRLEHAHSWVEARIEGRGWVTFDPTPSAGIGRGRNPDSAYRTLTRWMDGLRLIWYRHIVDYDEQSQRAMLDGFFGKQGVRKGLLFLFSLDQKLTNDRNGAGSRGEGLSGRQKLALILVGVAAFGVLVLMAREVMKLVGARRGGGRRDVVRARRVVPAYAALASRIERDVPRAPSQTPMEHARHVAQIHPAMSPFTDLTMAYYASRFSDAPWSEDSTRRAENLLATWDELTKPRGSRGSGLVRVKT